MVEPDSFPVTVGVRGSYEWLATDHRLDDLLRLCPEIVLGKYIAITSIDSGSYYPTEAEIAAGWERRNEIAYSPRIEEVETLPRDGWDEWYVFENRVDLGGMAPRNEHMFEASPRPGKVYDFVNINFSLHAPNMQGLAQYFWTQFDWIRPLTYIADSNDFLMVISSDRKLFGVARDALTALNSSSGAQSKSENDRS
jgi:hypothetical protein